MSEPTVPVTLRDLYEAYRVRRLQKASAGTLRKFQTSIGHFETAIGRTATLADLNDLMFSHVIYVWSKTLPLSPHSLNGYGGKIVCLWRFACRRGWLTVWPEPDWQLPAPTRIPRAWSRAELATLFGELGRQEGWVCGVPAAGWWLSLHHVLFDSGERISAVLSLRWADVDFSTRWCVVRGENRKGKTSDRAYLLHPDTIAGLRAIQYPPRELVFPWSLTLESLWLHYDRILQQAGLDHSRQSKFHKMRRSVASHIAASHGRAKATEQLDHADPRTTIESYIDPIIAPLTQPSDVLFRPGKD